MYLSGIGVEKDADAGVRWLSEAAEAGDVQAMVHLANAYMAGKQVDEIELRSDIFEVPVNVPLMHQALVRQMAHARQPIISDLAQRTRFSKAK